MAVALDTNPFVEHLKPKADDPALDATVLQGFLGAAGASHPARRRIYFSMALKEYAEFKGDDVLHRGKIPREHHPLGLEIDTVWLNQEAEITYVPPTWWPHPGYGGLYLFPGPYGGPNWAGAYGPYGGPNWAG